MDRPLPVLELTMTKDGLKIMLADENAALQVRIPEQMMQGIVDTWKAFQEGTRTETAYSRHYTGEWPK